MTTDRNFDEVLRVADSRQLTARHQVATPVNCKQGDDVIIAVRVSDDEAGQIFGGLEAAKPHIRIEQRPPEPKRTQPKGVVPCQSFPARPV